MCDSKEVKPPKEFNVEIDVEKYKDVGENSRKEYEELYMKMWSNLSEAHLEPFAKVMLERENIVLKGKDQLIESIRQHAQKALVLSLNNFWQAYGVSESLISLAMCKEKFKSFEGHAWDINSKTPAERTRPIRMRFKENRLRYLEAQSEFQQKDLDEVLKENAAYRQQIHDIRRQRIFLMENLELYRQKFAEAKEEIVLMHSEMLDEEENELLQLLQHAKINNEKYK